MEIFNVENLSYSYKDGKVALNDLSLTVQEGEAITIIGTNGSGKSTLLYVLDGLLEPSTGSITFFWSSKRKGLSRVKAEDIAPFPESPGSTLFSYCMG